MDANPEIAAPIPAVNTMKIKEATTIMTVDILDPRTRPSQKDPVSRYA